MSKPLAKAYTGKVTVPFIKVISVFLDHPQDQFTGSQIFKKTKLQSGTVYPLLAKLRELDWLEGEWEQPDPKSDRPPRRFYKITGSGSRAAVDVLRHNVSQKLAECYNQPETA